VLADSPGAEGQLDVILIGTGSEVSLCLAAYEKLVAEGVKARVVSLPSWELFEHQSQEYKDSVIPESEGAHCRLNRRQSSVGSAMQQHRSDCRHEFFGASAPLKELTKFGFTVEAVVEAAKERLVRLAKSVRQTLVVVDAAAIQVDGKEKGRKLKFVAGRPLIAAKNARRTEGATYE